MYKKGMTPLRTLWQMQEESKEARADYECSQLYANESAADKYDYYAALMTAKNKQ
jgi:hypothetical protein